MPFGIGFAVDEYRSANKLREKEEARVLATNKKIVEKNNLNKQYAIIAANQKIATDAEIVFLKNTIDITTKQLKMYYDLDIIYPKYRGLIYVCSIYEYLKSGICEGLIGPYGAYAMLENDIKFARVEEKMNSIITNLEQIKDNQMELYYAIRETNNQIAKLDESVKRVVKSIDRNTSNIDEMRRSINNIEYNAEVSADCNRFMASYHYFKN